MLILLGSDLLVQSTESQDAQNNKTSKGFPQVQQKRFKMNIAHMKSLQAQTKHKTQKSFSNYLRHKYSPTCSCPTLKVLKMDWTVNDGLYHRFLKWCLKCENILECELAMLPEKRQCKKVIAWSGDFGMDQYVSWNLSTDELMIDTIWEKFEEFASPN